MIAHRPWEERIVGAPGAVGAERRIVGAAKHDELTGVGAVSERGSAKPREVGLAVQALVLDDGGIAELHAVRPLR